MAKESRLARAGYRSREPDVVRDAKLRGETLQALALGSAAGDDETRGYPAFAREAQALHRLVEALLGRNSPEVQQLQGLRRVRADARIANEAEKRARFEAGELGLDIYNMRERLADKGLSYAEYSEPDD